MSRLVTNAIRSTAASSDAMTIDSAGKPAFPNGGVGKILQVVQTFKDDTTSTSSTSYVDISGMSVSITPSSTSSKILIFVSLGSISASGSVLAGFKLLRGSTAVGNSTSTSGLRIPSFTSVYTANNEWIQSAGHNFVDSPSTTSATTYKIQWTASSSTIYLNKYRGDTNNDGSSSIIAMEIAA